MTGQFLSQTSGTVEILFSANFDRFQIEKGKRFYLVEKQSKIDIYS